MTSQQIAPPGEAPERGLPAVLERIRGEVAGLADTLFAARPGSELMDTVVGIEALKSTLEALELGVVAELEASGAVKGSGWASTADFVTHVAGGSKGTGPAMVRLAEAVAEPLLAPVATALGQGWLSGQQARVIERAVDGLPGDAGLRARGVEVLLSEARALDATELRRVARRLLTIVDPEGDDRRDEQALDRLERAAHLGRHLTLTDDQAGGAWIRGRCSTEDAAFLKATLIPLAAPRPSDGPPCEPATCKVPGCRHDGRDPRDHGVRMLDALTEACRLLQSADVLPESHGATPRLTLTMRLEDLRERTGCASTETAEELSASAVRRLCCDADVIPVVLGAGSEVMDVGRTQRLVTAAIWRALVARDAHCRFPHCTRPPMMCHAHHVEHWVDGGPTSLDNLVLLCGHHHRLVHAGPWTVRVAAAGRVEIDPPPGVRRPQPPADPG